MSAALVGRRVVIAHGEVPAGAPPQEVDTLVQADAVAQALASLGCKFSTMAVGPPLEDAAARCAALRPDVVFNLVEGVNGSNREAIRFVALLEQAGGVVTGPSAAGLLLTEDKLAAKRALRDHGLPTPAWVEWGALSDSPCRPDSVDMSDDLRAAARPFRPGRYIVKSVWEHGSHGLDETSVQRLSSRKACANALQARRIGMGGAWFAESYIEGRECCVGLLEGAQGPALLPVCELRFEGAGAGATRIVGEAAKWDEESAASRRVTRLWTFPPKDEAMVRRLRRLAVEAWRLLGLAGFARVDFRIDAVGEPWLIDINANPCLSPDSGFAAQLAKAGVPFHKAIEGIVLAALRRTASAGPAAGLSARMTRAPTLLQTEEERSCPLL